MKKIYDAHLHFWDYQSGHWTWLDSDLPGADEMIGDYKNLKKDYLPGHFKCDIAGLDVDGCTFIQAFGYPNNPFLELKWAGLLKQKTTYPSKIISFIDLKRRDVVSELLLHAEVDGFCGVRNVLCHHEKPELCMIDDPGIFEHSQWRAGIKALSDNGYIFEAQIFDHQLPSLLSVAKTYPDLKIVIEHFAWPTQFSSDAFKLWQTRILPFVPLNNVIFKMSAFGCVFKRLNAVLIKPYFDFLIEHFGISRCIFGSNFPVDGLYFTYYELIDFCDKKLCVGFSAEEKNRIFYQNAKCLYGS